MGNCGLGGHARFRHNVVKLVHSNGLIEEFFRPIKAGELLVDYPNHFICHGDGLSQLLQSGSGHALTHLAADDDMEIGQIYFLLPKQMLYSKPSHADIAALLSKASKAKKASYRGSQLGPLPLPAQQRLYGHLEEEEDDDDDEKEEDEDNDEKAERRREFVQRLLAEVKIQIEKRAAADSSLSTQLGSTQELKTAYTSHMLAKSYTRLWCPPLDTIDEDTSSIPA